MELQIIRAQEFIRLGAHGHFDLKASKAVLATLAGACLKRGIHQALLDLRALHPGPKPVFSPGDLVTLVNTFRQIGFTHQQRLGVLYRSDPHHRASMFASIARLRGWSVKAFDNFEEAVTWLSRAEQEPSEVETESTTKAKKVPVRQIKHLQASSNAKPAGRPTIHILASSNRTLAAFSRCVFPVAGKLLLILACLTGGPVLAAEEPGLVTKTKEVAQETTAAVTQAGRSAAVQAEELWQRIDAARLKNRTPDEMVAWVIMGVLVGALAGMMTSLKPTGLGKLGRLLLGLAGASLGGIVVRLTGLNFGWGPVLIRYEDLAFSLLGAILLLVLARLVRSRSKKQVPKT